MHDLLTALTLGARCGCFHSCHCSLSGWPLLPPISLSETRAVLTYGVLPICDSSGERQEEEGRERKQKGGRKEGRTEEGRVLVILSFKTLFLANLGTVVLIHRFFFLPTPPSNFPLSCILGLHVPCYRRPICSNVSNCVDPFRKHIHFNWTS